MIGRGASVVGVVIALFATASSAQEAPAVDPADPAPVVEPVRDPAVVDEPTPVDPAGDPPAAEPRPEPRRRVIGLPHDDVEKPLDDERDPPERSRLASAAPEPDEPLLPSTKPLAELGPGSAPFTVAACAAGGACLASPLVVLTFAMPCTLCAAMPMFSALGAMTGFWAADLPLQPGPIVGAAVAGGVGSLLVFGGLGAGYVFLLAGQGASQEFLFAGGNIALVALALAAVVGGVLMAAVGTGAVAWLLVDEPAPPSSAPKPLRPPAPAARPTAMVF